MPWLAVGWLLGIGLFTGRGEIIDEQAGSRGGVADVACGDSARRDQLAVGVHSDVPLVPIEPAR